MPVPESQGVVARSLLRDDAYRTIRDAIVDGTLAPGERLNDPDLIAWLGISRTPIREALARLEQAGLVQTKPGRFTIVSPLNVRETRSAQLVAAAMHELAVREAVPLMSEQELRAMRGANRRFRLALRANDVDAALAADDDFHEVAVEACANPMIRSVLEQVTPMLRRIERIRFASLTGRTSAALHDKIITHATAGDADAAALAARENWLTLEPLLAEDDG
ncbi:GntR family transcriptional regulator [Kribbella catacumbae]|uniref:GntR family transcriptional regulator n=1 Tax=Kribbella catacumbae TaxID=460086 RepID=UPI00035FC763|nr:GntR family transcriptional regulator [Kribbella catacumbae]